MMKRSLAFCIIAPPLAAPTLAQTPAPPMPVQRYEEFAARPLATPLPEPDQRLIDAPSVALSTQGYTHFSLMAADRDGELHLFSYAGRRHGMGEESSIAYRVSRDRGATWLPTRAILRGEGQDREYRIGAAGVTARGRLIVTAVELDRWSGEGRLGSIHSDDGGNTWSAFAVLNEDPPSPYRTSRSKMLPHGDIRATPGGRLLMMAYIGRFNYLMTSDDEGATWRRSVMIESEMPDYSEIALGVVDEQTYIAVSRIDRQRSAMAQFVTRDGGRSWQLLGPLPMPVAGGYVSPTLERVETAEGPVLLLGVTDRWTGRTWLRTAPAAAAARTTQAWSGPRVIVSGLRVRSGYQATATDIACGRVVVAVHRELSDRDVALEVLHVPADAVGLPLPPPREDASCRPLGGAQARTGPRPQGPNQQP